MKEYPYIPPDYSMSLAVIEYLVERQGDQDYPEKIKRMVLDKRWNPQLMKFRAICILSYKLTHA